MARGKIYANRREWSKAAIDYEKCLSILGDQQNHGSVPAIIHSLAACYMLADDEAGFFKLCDAALRGADHIDVPSAASSISRACSLSDVAGLDRTAATRLAQQAVSANPKSAWYLYGLGVAHYRNAQYEQSIARLQESLQPQPNWLGRGQNYLILAMACHQLRRPEEAKEWLAKAKPALDELEQTVGSASYGFAGSPYLSDWLTMRVLRLQAERLLAVNANP